MNRARPRREEIAGNLIEAIASGRYAVGQTLPTEHELSALFGVSRFTASHALDQLEHLGMVSRKPRQGTRVISRFPLSNFVEQGGILQEWTGYGTEFILELDTIEERPPLPILGMSGTGRRPWLYLAGLRHPKGNDLPACLSEIWVHPDYKDIRGRLTTRPPLIFTLIEERYGPLVRRVRHEIRAVPVEEAIAKKLNVEAGSPGLQTLRRYFGPRDQIVEVVVNTHPHDRFTYAIEVRRSIETELQSGENVE